MNYDLKIYGLLGLNTSHLETIDKIYGSVIEKDFRLEEQPKRVRDIIKRLAQLPGNLRPKFVFESSVSEPAKKFKAMAHSAFSKRKRAV